MGEGEEEGKEKKKKKTKTKTKNTANTTLWDEVKSLSVYEGKKEVKKKASEQARKHPSTRGK